MYIFLSTLQKKKNELWAHTNLAARSWDSVRCVSECTVKAVGNNQLSNAAHVVVIKISWLPLFLAIVNQINAIGLRSGDLLGQSKTFYFFSLVEVFFCCVGSVLWVIGSLCMMKFIPISFSISWQTECFCRLLNSSCCCHHELHHQKAISEPTPEAATALPPPCFSRELVFLDHEQIPSFSTLWPFHHFRVV